MGQRSVALHPVQMKSQYLKALCALESRSESYTSEAISSRFYIASMPAVIQRAVWTTGQLPKALCRPIAQGTEIRNQPKMRCGPHSSSPKQCINPRLAAQSATYLHESKVQCGPRGHRPSCYVWTHGWQLCLLYSPGLLNIVSFTVDS